MLRPHVAGGMLVISSSGRRRYELQGLLGVGRDPDSGANLPESGRCLVDLDVDVWVFEKGDGSTETTDAAADDCDTERFGESSRRRHVVLVLR